MTRDLLIEDDGRTFVSPLEDLMHGKALPSKFVAHQLRHANLVRPGRTDSLAQDFQFHTNEAFWIKVLAEDRVSIKWVELPRFQIVDWFPRTPGLYHSHKGREALRKCGGAIYTEKLGWFYRVQDKYHLMEGGIGSVRFKPIFIEGDRYWLCTATSDGYCHSGIPLALPDSLLCKVDFKSALYYRVIGEVNFLPEFLERIFSHWINIPQVYIRVNQVDPIQEPSVVLQ